MQMCKIKQSDNKKIQIHKYVNFFVHRLHFSSFFRVSCPKKTKILINPKESVPLESGFSNSSHGSLLFERAAGSNSHVDPLCADHLSS